MGKSKKITKHIFDLDHTLYLEPDDKYDCWARANQKALSDFGVVLPLDEVKAIGHAAYMAHKHQLSGFVEKYNLDFEALNQAYHAHAIEEYKGKVVPNKRLADHFNAIAAEDKVILTHSIDIWTDAMLEVADMKASMDPANILAQCHPMINHVRKNESDVPIRAALQVLNARPEQTAMYDDMHLNFEHAHDMGLHTVLIHWGREVPKTRPKNVSQMAIDITQKLK